MIFTLIPVYNCEHTIAKIILKAIRYSDMVFAYDDGSTDYTKNILDSLTNYSNFRFESDPINRGKGYALKQLFLRVQKWKMHNPKVIITIDGDDQHNPDEIPKLIEPILNDEADVTIGQRSDLPFFRKIGIKVLDFITKTKESQCGFRAYNFLAYKLINIETDGFGVDTQILEDLKKTNLVIKNVPITVKYDKYSHTMNPFSHFLEVLFNIIVRNPLSLSLVGLLSVIGSSLLLFDVVRVWNTVKELSIGRLMGSSVLLTVGITMIFSGLIIKLLREK